MYHRQPIITRSISAESRNSKKRKRERERERDRSRPATAARDLPSRRNFFSHPSSSARIRRSSIHLSLSLSLVFSTGNSRSRFDTSANIGDACPHRMSLCSEKRGGVISTTTKGTARALLLSRNNARVLSYTSRSALLARQGEYIYRGLSDSKCRVALRSGKRKREASGIIARNLDSPD